MGVDAELSPQPSAKTKTEATPVLAETLDLQGTLNPHEDPKGCNIAKIFMEPLHTLLLDYLRH